MTMFPDQFPWMLGAKANSVVTCVGDHCPRDFGLTNGLLTCGRVCVPVLRFAAPLAMAETGMGGPESAADADYCQSAPTNHAGV